MLRGIGVIMLAFLKKECAGDHGESENKQSATCIRDTLANKSTSAGLAAVVGRK